MCDIVAFLIVINAIFRGMVVNEGPGTSSQPQVNIKRQGTWADSEVEKALKSILAFAKNYRGNYLIMYWAA